MGGRLPEREQKVENLLRYARALHQEQDLRAQMAYPQVHRMDTDDTPREEQVTPGPGGPPPPPPPGMGELLRSHNQMRAQIEHMANYVHETTNRAQQLEQHLATQEYARAYRKAEKRQAAAAMYRQALYGPQAAAPPFLNQVIGQAAVPPPAAPAEPAAPAASMATDAIQEKREADERLEAAPKRQIVERVVERILERPADLSRPSVPDPPPQAAITYEPPKAISDVMPYTHAGNPELARAVAHVVAALASEEKRGPKRAADPEFEEATQAADQSGSKPVVVRKKTRYTTMSRFNAAQLIRRREAARRALQVRRGEREAIRVATEEAAKKVDDVVRRVVKKTKSSRNPRPARPVHSGAKMTPGRRVAVAA